MRKISTKIIALTMANTLIITVLNTLVTTLMPKGTMNANPTAAGSAPAGQMFLMPTSVMASTVASLLIGIVIAYFLGRYISKPILKVTEITNRTAELDLAHDEAFEQTLKYKDECGAMAVALMDTRKSLRQMAAKLKSISSSLESHSQNLTKTTDENVRTINQIVSTINEIAEGNSNQAQTANDINATLFEAVKLIEDITEEASRSADNAVKSLDTIKEGQNAVDIQAKKNGRKYFCIS